MAALIGSRMHGALLALVFLLVILSSCEDNEEVAFVGRQSPPPTTSSFSVIQTHPDSGETGVSRSVIVQVRFNSNLDTTSIPRALTISPYVPGLITAYSGASSFYFYSSTLYQPHTKYTVRVGTAIRTLTGDSLATPYVFPFTTGLY